MYWLMFSVFAAAAIFYQARNEGVAALPAGPAEPVRPGRSIAPAVVAIFLLVLIGLRYRVGGDWANYLEVYEFISRQTITEAFDTSAQEPAYTLINWISGQFGAGMWLVNFASALPFVIGVILLSRQQANFWLALLVATPFLIIVVGMGYTRQAAALGFLMIGISELIQRRSLMRLIGWVLIGSLFHRTVLIFIPLILMATGPRRGIVFLLGILTVVIAYFTVLPSALERYSTGYIRSEYKAAGAGVRVVMNLIPAVLLILTGDRLYRSQEEKIVWRTFALMAVVAAIALPFVASSVIVDRLSIYLIPLQMFVLSRLPYSQFAANSGVLWRLLIIFYTGLVLFVWLNYAVNAGSWVPYGNYLVPGTG